MRELPRERLLSLGPTALSADELIAVVLGRGVRGRPAGTLARALIDEAGSLARLARSSPHELARQCGVGDAQGARVAAAFELGRRAVHATAASSPTVSCAADVFARLQPRLAGLEQEVFVALALDVRNRIREEIEVSRGTLTGVDVHPREVFRPLVRQGAAAVVVAHNHPSGDPTPSPEDLALTQRLRKVGDLVGIPLLDHVVIAGDRYCSLAEHSCV